MELLDQKRLLQLAPNDLEIRRSNRYDGTALSLSLTEFSTSDQERIRTIYNTVNAMYQTWLRHDKALLCSAVQECIHSVADPLFFQLIHALGTGNEGEVDAGYLNKIHKALHDIRGGCLSGLIGISQLILELGEDTYRMQRAVYMARDHAKIMRNILIDIDSDNREEDESVQAHHINQFIEKLTNLSFEYDELKLSAQLHCTFEGYISNCCLETSSIDRILFNFINNAAKYSANHKANVYIYPVNERMIRWVFENPVSDAHLAWFHANCDETMKDLFLSNRTYQGQGIGLYTCSEIVGNSFGIPKVEKTVQDGYIGAKLERNMFYSWFHWPILGLG